MSTLRPDRVTDGAGIGAGIGAVISAGRGAGTGVGANAETADSSWRSLYKLGGVTAMMAVLVYLLDVIITFLPGWAPEPGTLTVTDWFTLLQGNWVLGLRTLGFTNVFALALAVPMFLALYGAHRQVNRAYAALAMLFWLVGTAIYISNNPAVPMYVLSGKYAAATTDAQRSALVAAGEAMLVRGEDFTPGAFMGFFLTEVASMTISFVMLRGRIFSKAAAYVGILGCAFLTIFTIWSTFVPVLFGVATILAISGGLLNLAWFILVARRLFKLGQGV